MLLVFNNTSNNYYQANIEAKARGTKSFCIYCDSDASEDSLKVTKQMPPKTARAVMIMKYTNSSLFSISYGVSASSAAAAAAASKNKGNANTGANTNQQQQQAQSANDDDDIRNDPVFKQDGEPIDEDGTIYQYFKEEKNGFTIGLENRGKSKEKFKLILEGLDFTDSVNRGRSTSIPFDLYPRERKKWYVSLKSRYSGDLSFQFDYA